MTNDLDLKSYIREIPDFPSPGILFRDITPLLRAPAAFAQALDAMTAAVERLAPTAVVGIESRGFIFGAPIAQRLSLPFVPIRRAGKLPYDRMSVDYELEYGMAQMEIHTDALTPNDRVAVIDDLIATGGTANGACQLVDILGAEVAGLVFLIELVALAGRTRLGQRDITTLIKYD